MRSFYSQWPLSFPNKPIHHLSAVMAITSVNAGRYSLYNLQDSRWHCPPFITHTHTHFFSASFSRGKSVSRWLLKRWTVSFLSIYVLPCSLLFPPILEHISDWIDPMGFLFLDHCFSLSYSHSNKPTFTYLYFFCSSSLFI